MKFRTTQKAIKEGYNKIICIPYCGLQNLLNYETPIAYTAGGEGWKADIYDIGGGVAIVTGYAPFGNVRPSYEVRQKYEKEAETILEAYYRNATNYKHIENRLKELLQQFVEEVTQ